MQQDEQDTRPAGRQADPAAASAVDATPIGADDPAARLAKAEADAADLKDQWLRARADVENVRKQAAAEVQKASRFAIERFAADLLPVRDSLEQALAVDATTEQLRAGVELTLKELAAAFTRAQVVEVDPAPGEKFDPHRHQAMQVVAAAQPANTVVQVVQKGYVLNDRVLRPAMVTVAKAPDA